MNADTVIRQFASFLNHSWKVAITVLKSENSAFQESFTNDWLQANWELLVERKVLCNNEYLEVYSSGADFIGSSSRITDVEALPTHKIQVKCVNNKDYYDILNDVYLEECTQFEFIEFVSLKNGFYSKSPNFNYLLVCDKKGIERVFDINSITFNIARI